MSKDLEAIILDERTVVVFSEYNGLSVSLVEKLLSNFFRVEIVCVKKELWIEKAPYLKENAFVSFLDFENQGRNFDFLIFVSAFFNNISGERESFLLKNEESRIKKSLSEFVPGKKRFFILPYFVFDRFGKRLIDIYNKNIDFDTSIENIVVYTGNLVGSRMVLNERDEVLMLLKSLVEKEPVRITRFIPPEIRPSRVADVSRKLVEIISLEKIDYSRILISGISFTFNDWILDLKKNFADFKYFVDDKKIIKKNGFFEKEFILSKKVDFKFLKETIDWFRNSYDKFYLEDTSLFRKENIAIEEEKKFLFVNNLTSFPRLLSLYFNTFKKRFFSLFDQTRPFFALKSMKFSLHNLLVKKNLVSKSSNLTAPKTKPSFLQKYVIFSFSAVLTFIAVPLISLILSMTSFYLGVTRLRNGNFQHNKEIFYFTSKAANFSLSQFSFYSDIPFFGNFFVVPAKAADVSLQVSEIALLLVDGGQYAFSFFEKSLSGQELPVKEYSQNLFLIADSLYKKVSFLDAQLKEIVESWPFVFFESYVRSVDFARRREEIQAAKTAFSLLDDILGQEREKLYLVLLQNNMELRPTGGFIGSFAVVGFNKGAMTKFEVYDVYSADGQLKGYVEPPWQLKEYLDQPAWYLRDSNWNPDFPKSAQRAEWFLDKSMDIRVDGVIAVDLVFVRELIKVFGSVFVQEFDKTIDYKNFYEVVQYEAEKDFFPGSRQKQNFLLSLSRHLINRLKISSEGDAMRIFEIFYQALNRRHIQVFLHQADLQDKIENIGWSGSLKPLYCLVDNCLYDWASLIEANLGVNKANYFVTRELSLKVSVFQNAINRNLEARFFNKSQFFMGDKGKYKAYLRLLLPVDSKVRGVSIKKNDNLETISYREEVLGGIKEVGFLLEIGPTESISVYFEWESEGVDLGKNGEYKFLLRKQAGIDKFPFLFNISFPSNFIVGYDKFLHLTKDGSFVYNNPNLSEDFTARFYW